MKTLVVLSVLALLAVLVCPTAAAGDSPWTLRFHGAVVQSSGSRHTTAVSGAFSTGLRYMKADAEGRNFDPLIVTIGFAYRF